MKDQLKTIRAALTVLRGAVGHPDNITSADKAVDALTQLEAMVGEQEPVAWRVHPFDYGIGHEGVYATTHLTQQRDAWLRKGWNVESLYTAAPVAQQYEAGDMASAAAQGFRDGVASVAQQQEPVAWAMPKGDGTFIDVITPAEHAREEGSYTVPLFAHPVAQQPQAEAVRVECHEVIAGVTGNTVRPRELTEREHNVLMRAMVCSGKKVEAPQQAEAVPPDVVRDAERYRKLRTFHWSESSMCVVLDPKKSVLLGATCPSGTNLDDYVDAAIAQQKGQP